MRLYTLIYMSFFGIFLVLFITYSEIQTYIEGFLPSPGDIRYQHQLCPYHIRVLQLLVKFSSNVPFLTVFLHCLQREVVDFIINKSLKPPYCGNSWGSSLTGEDDKNTLDFDGALEADNIGISMTNLMIVSSLRLKHRPLHLNFQPMIDET